MKWKKNEKIIQNTSSLLAAQQRRFSVRVDDVGVCAFAYKVLYRFCMPLPGCIEKGRLIHLLGSRRGSDDGTHGTPKQAHTKCRYVYIFTYIRAAVKTPCS